ncbi:uncharacterized protein VTP21DRAFT_6228 [Calcarisporiella thermophila]|uniref:uncharacterized protein n=1 Tax=Calcarisporiella thermophila TaxID=911321 RepID=UPI003742BD22
MADLYHALFRITDTSNLRIPLPRPVISRLQSWLPPDRSRSHAINALWGLETMTRRYRRSKQECTHPAADLEERFSELCARCEAAMPSILKEVYSAMANAATHHAAQSLHVNGKRKVKIPPTDLEIVLGKRRRDGEVGNNEERRDTARSKDPLSTTIGAVDVIGGERGIEDKSNDTGLEHTEQSVDFSEGGDEESRGKSNGGQASALNEDDTLHFQLEEIVRQYGSSLAAMNSEPPSHSLDSVDVEQEIKSKHSDGAVEAEKDHEEGESKEDTKEEKWRELAQVEGKNKENDPPTHLPSANLETPLVTADRKPAASGLKSSPLGRGARSSSNKMAVSTFYSGYQRDLSASPDPLTGFDDDEPEQRRTHASHTVPTQSPTSAALRTSSADALCNPVGHINASEARSLTSPLRDPEREDRVRKKRRFADGEGREDRLSPNKRTDASVPGSTRSKLETVVAKSLTTRTTRSGRRVKPARGWWQEGEPLGVETEDAIQEIGMEVETRGGGEAGEDKVEEEEEASVENEYFFSDEEE